MADDFEAELDAADDAAGKLAKAIALWGQMAMLRAAADRLDVPSDRTLN